MKLSFLSLASGSSGNCYYLGTPEFGVLIDAGIGIRTIKKILKDHGLDFDKIVAVLVTHDHADHIKTVGYLGEKIGIPIYSTEGVHRGIQKSRYVEECITTSKRIIEKETPFMIRDFQITAFEVPHDSTDSVGYFIEYGAHRFTFATDVGHITETVGKYICKANHLILEAKLRRRDATLRHLSSLFERTSGQPHRPSEQPGGSGVYRYPLYTRPQRHLALPPQPG